MLAYRMNLAFDDEIQFASDDMIAMVLKQRTMAQRLLNGNDQRESEWPKIYLVNNAEKDDSLY